MTRVFVAVAAGVMIAAASCTAKGAVSVSSIARNSAGQDDNQAVTLRPMRLDNASQIDGIKLVEVAGQPTLLYSTQAETADRRYELVLRGTSLADVSRAREVARIGRMLPTPPQWDARPVGDRYEFVYEVAGGAVNAIFFQDAQGTTTRVSAEHPFESFTRPHFVRSATRGSSTPDIGAVADLKKIVVFPGGATAPPKYRALADGADGIVGGSADHWIVAKNAMSGAALFDRLPGRLTLSGTGSPNGSNVVPDLLVYELDAAEIGNDVVVFATSKPALMILGRRPARPVPLLADDRSWLLSLSQPTVLVTAQFVHLAAIARPGSDQAVILHAAVPLSTLRGQ